jgi:hypothetical protein
MEERRRSNLVVGILLVLLGAWFLLDQLVPGLHFWVNAQVSWPLFVVGTGVLLLVIGLLAGAPDMAVPACIVGGIGGLLYWQNTTGNWESWAYAWTLIPGFVGVGVILAGILKGQVRRGFSAGIGSIIVSLIMFAIFSSFLGGWQLFGAYWPVLLILLGLWILVRGLIWKR